MGRRSGEQQGSQARRHGHRAWIGCLTALLLFVIASPLQASQGTHRVGATADVTDDTLVVHIHTRADVSCATRLGDGDEAVQLPTTRTNGNGRARLTWPIADDAPTGRQPLTIACGHGASRANTRFGVTVAASGDRVMSIVLNVLLDVLLGGSLLLFVVLLLDLVVRAPDSHERFLRSLALIAGAVIALGAQASGNGFADYIVNSLVDARPADTALKIAALIVPGGMAAFFGWYFTRALDRTPTRALRLMCLLGMLTLVAFTVIFAQATNTQGLYLGTAAIPNASFVVGLALSALMFARADDDSPRRGTSWFAVFGRRPRATFEGGLAAEPPKPTADPFADPLVAEDE